MRTSKKAMGWHLTRCYQVTCDVCGETEVVEARSRGQAIPVFIRMGWREQAQRFSPLWCGNCCHIKRIVEKEIDG